MWAAVYVVAEKDRPCVGHWLGFEIRLDLAGDLIQEIRAAMDVAYRVGPDTRWQTRNRNLRRRRRFRFLTIFSGQSLPHREPLENHGDVARRTPTRILLRRGRSRRARKHLAAPLLKFAYPPSPGQATYLEN